MTSRKSPPECNFFLFIIGIVIFVGSHIFIEGREFPIKIEEIVQVKNISEQSVHCVIQDKRGFIWVATGDGLNRYDGYDFTYFCHKPFDDATLADNFILTMCEDRDGYLWLGTRNGGLNRFDWETETFTHFLPVPGDSTSISNGYVNVIIEDHKGDLWVGTIRGGLNRMNRSTSKFTQYMYDPSNPKGVSNNTILSILEDKSRAIWIGTNGGGINRYNEKTGDFTVFQHDPKNPSSLRNNSVWALYEDRDGDFWVGTAAGLDRFIREENRFIHYAFDPKSPNSTGFPLISSIVEDNRGRLWLGSGTINVVGNGFTIFTKKNEQFYSYPLQGENNAIVRKSIYSLFKDSLGRIWLGSIGCGLLRYDPRKYKFKHYQHDPANPNSLSGRSIWAVCEDRDGNLWAGVEEGGVNFINRETGKYTFYNADPRNPHSLYGNSVRVLMEDSDGDMWIGTDKGLNRWERSTGRFIHVLKDTSGDDMLIIPRVSALMQDREGFIWIGTWGNGVSRMDKKNGALVHYENNEEDSDSLSENKISTIYEGMDGTLWIGTISKGLNRFDKKTGKFIHFSKGCRDSNCLSSDAVTSIYQQEPDVLWLGTWSGGLNRLDLKKNRISCYTGSGNLFVRSIYGVLGDKQGNLWLSTNRGIFKFDPRAKNFLNYTEEDGLQNNEFNQGSFFKGRKGELFFGGINGINAFFPEQIAVNTNIPRIVLIDFKIFGTSYRKYTNKRLHYFDNDHIYVRLNYKENNFSIEFAAIEYTNPQNNQYAYMMEGVDKDWVFCGSRRYANYINLPGGYYTFRIIGSNNDGIWNKKGISVHITLIPPLWRTPAFRLLLLVIIITCVSVFYYYRTQKFKEEIQRQEKIHWTLKRSRDELRKAKKLIEYRHAEVVKLVSAITSILIAIDAKGHINQWNKAAEEFFGLSHPDVVGMKFTEIMSRFMKKEDVKAIIQVDFSQTPSHEREIRLTIMDSERLLLFLISPIIDKTGKKRGLLLLCEDITQRQAELARQNLFMKLKFIGQIHAGISHDMITPLQHIQFNSKTISESILQMDECSRELRLYLNDHSGSNPSLAEIDRLLDKNQVLAALANCKEASEMIDGGVNQAIEITRAMREFFHPGNDKMEMCDINKLLSSILIVTHYKIRKIADVESQMEDGPLFTMCYPAQLNQVFLNIILNAADAVKETGKRGKIYILSRIEQEQIVVEIADTGPGISEKNIDRIFQPYFTTKEMGLGVGLGLSMAKKIIEEIHAGAIYFRNRPTGGVTFFIHIPLKSTVDSFFTAENQN